MNNGVAERRGARRRGGGRRGDATVRRDTEGGRLSLLGESGALRIHAASLALLAEPGLSEAPPVVVELVTAAGGQVAADGRLIFPPALCERALAGLRRSVTLCGRDPAHDLTLAPGRVYLGSGGAAPLLRDIDTGLYRPSTLGDLYDAARLVDRLPNVQFFSRSLVAGDIEEPRALDINTCYAALAGTAKHVMTSASSAAHVAEIAAICHAVAGSDEAFLARPFLSLNINHVAPPLRFAPEASEVLVAAARAGIPCMVNTFGQLGASSPVTIAGCVAQTNAETLAGLVVAWLANPDAIAIHGARPMVTDLRSGAMAGGSGEQAILTAAAVEMARFYGLGSSTIAGATDSKTADAQSGYEKALSVTMAAQSGANLVTQAAGMQAGLMGASFEAYVIDNDMLGAVLRSLSPIDTGPDALSPDMIAETVRGAGHFLGHPETYRRMTTDFLYPEIADRQPIESWEAAGGFDIRTVARLRAREILAGHFPAHLPRDLDDRLRARHDIRLPLNRMEPP
ncbi:MAG: trimethylamine methyltransferase family protein [Pseudomonadota bacterium]